MREDPAAERWSPRKHRHYSNEGKKNGSWGIPRWSQRNLHHLEWNVEEYRKNEEWESHLICAIGHVTRLHPQDLVTMWVWNSWNGCFAIQDLHTSDPAVLAILRVALCVLSSTRTIRVGRVARIRFGILLRIDLHMSLGMAIDTAIGLCTARHTEEGREAELFP